MARLPRLVIGGYPHLVLLRALAGEPAFAAEADRHSFLEALRESAASERVQVHAFGLFGAASTAAAAVEPTLVGSPPGGEARLLLTPPDSTALSRSIQALGRRYVSAYNRRHGRQGTLWTGRFRCALVEPGENTLDAMAWVESSEALASSAAHHLGEARDLGLVDPAAYWALGNTPFDRESAWARRCAAGLPAITAAQIARAAAGGWVFGSAPFVRERAAGTARPLLPRAPGRPRRIAGPA